MFSSSNQTAILYSEQQEKGLRKYPEPVRAVNPVVRNTVATVSKFLDEPNAGSYDINSSLPYQTDLLTINIASTEQCTVFLNGQVVGTVNDWRIYRTLSLIHI